MCSIVGSGHRWAVRPDAARRRVPACDLRDHARARPRRLRDQSNSPPTPSLSEPRDCVQVLSPFMSSRSARRAGEPPAPPGRVPRCLRRAALGGAHGVQLDRQTRQDAVGGGARRAPQREALGARSR